MDKAKPIFKKPGRLSRGWKVFLGIFGLLFIWYLFCLPRNLFKDVQYSTMVLDRNGELLGARIADDGQWRFPPYGEVPEKYATALIQFEDQYFKYHPGVNPISIIRALIGNIRSGKITSGGSTITMQVIRLSRRGERTIKEKIVEAILATRLELRYSKKRILFLYASHAPFGGNVVGMKAASWRYFGRDPEDLSWGEAALLAVLPNAPSGIHPGKNRELLLGKRNNLLKKLYEKGKIDEFTYELACAEPLPASPLPLPTYASHLVDRLNTTNHGEIVKTDIDIHLQRQVEGIMDEWNKELSETGVGDLASVVIDVHTGNIIAYCGNAAPQRKRPGAQVDILRSPRSTGSILKPILYCALLQDGEILPKTLIADLPVNINGFSPENYDNQFSGAVHADEALARSLNVPAVHMLRAYSVPRFKDVLTDCGMSTLTREAQDYGLSLILGGAEGTLLDITMMYANLSRICQGMDPLIKKYPLRDRMAVYYTLDALTGVNRPDEIDPKMLRSVTQVSWKTGTSYGARDAWAVGTTPRYAVGVWAGNAQGQGVAGMTGARTSGPVMFELLNVLPSPGGTFEAPPGGELVDVCPLSGHLATPSCPKVETIRVPEKGIYSSPCPYHIISGADTLFKLPPAMEWFYRRRHPEYEATRGRTEKPGSGAASSPMEFIYPEQGAVITLPIQLDGKRKGAVFNLAHSDATKRIFWHLDETYIGSTRYIHEMTLAPEPGNHIVTVVDEDGWTLAVGFTIDEGNNQRILR